MALYDYNCQKCGQTFEVRQKFADEPLKVHEGCGGTVTRLISAPAIQFKGTGWYITDYARNGKSPSTSGANGKSEGKSEAKSEGTSESKSETKSETKTESPKTESKADSK